MTLRCPVILSPRSRHRRSMRDSIRSLVIAGRSCWSNLCQSVLPEQSGPVGRELGGLSTGDHPPAMLRRSRSGPDLSNVVLMTLSRRRQSLAQRDPGDRRLHLTQVTCAATIPATGSSGEAKRFRATGTCPGSLWHNTCRHGSSPPILYSKPSWPVLGARQPIGALTIRPYGRDRGTTWLTPGRAAWCPGQSSWRGWNGAERSPAPPSDNPAADPIAHDIVQESGCMPSSGAASAS